MGWYRWGSIETFMSWHDDVCTALGIPYPNVNQETREIDESAQWTLAYTSPVVLAGDDIRAVVEPGVLELVGGLGVPCDPPPVIVPDIIVGTTQEMIYGD